MQHSELTANILKKIKNTKYALEKANWMTWNMQTKQRITKVIQKSITLQTVTCDTSLTTNVDYHLQRNKYKIQKIK